MAISPIQMFQNNQSSLAQLLQGGTQTISGIMDQAIQVGRDISNKQLAQERDMLGMRQQETAMAQRRAENLQQNNEDAQRFARSAFESDRRYNTDLAQQGVQNNRQATQDLFQQSNADRNFSLSERNVGVSEGGLQIRQDELAADRATKEANQAYFRDKYSNTSAPQQRELQGPTQTGDPLVVNMLSSGTSTINNPDIVKLYEQRQYLENDSRSATEPQVKSQISSMLGTVNGQIAQLPKARSAPAQKSPEELEIQNAKLVEIRAKGQASAVTSAIKNYRTAFPGFADREEVNLRERAAAAGKKPEDFLYSADVTEEQRAAILKAQAGQENIEINAINSAKNEDEYVGLIKNLSEADVAERRNLYRTVKKGKSTAPSGAPKELTPQEKAEADAQALFNS